jgi:hypothetical protein
MRPEWRTSTTAFRVKRLCPSALLSQARECTKRQREQQTHGTEGRVNRMAEYIECRHCESPNCKGCNVYSLAIMLHTGKFDCLMDGSRTVNRFADVAPVRHGRWVDKLVRDWHCSECGKKVPRQVYFDGYCYADKLNYCPNCGALMDLEGENT